MYLSNKSKKTIKTQLLNGNLEVTNEGYSLAKIASN